MTAISARFGVDDGSIEAFTVDRVVLRLATAHAPGTPLAGTFEDGGETHPIELKVRSCKRAPDGRFVIDGRPMNLTRGVRDRLTTLLAPTSLPSSVVAARGQSGLPGAARAKRLAAVHGPRRPACDQPYTSATGSNILKASHLWLAFSYRGRGAWLGALRDLARGP